MLFVACPIEWSRAYSEWSFLTHFKSYRPQFQKSKNNNSIITLDILELKQTLVQVASEVLNIDFIDENASLIELGLDSLGVVELRNRLEIALNIKLPSIFSYNYPSITDMLSYFTSISSPQTKEVSSTQISNEPIAIISMSCRLPGEVFSPEDFWSMIYSGKDCVGQNSIFTIRY